MLIIANGAYKSGSTWQFNILREITHFEPVPEAYQKANWNNPTLNSTRFMEFVNGHDLHNAHYLVKNHILELKLRDAIIDHPAIFVFNIRRDLRDVLVSAYYHFLRHQNVEMSFEAFYYEHGMTMMTQVTQFHHFWEQVQWPRYYCASYEGLHRDFAAEVRGMANFLGFSLTDEDIQRIQQNTQISQLRVQYGEADEAQENRFFRKGEVNDWKNHFTPEMLNDFEAKQTQLAKSPPRWRQWFKQLFAN